MTTIKEAFIEGYSKGQEHLLSGQLKYGSTQEAYTLTVNSGQILPGTDHESIQTPNVFQSMETAPKAQDYKDEEIDILLWDGDKIVIGHWGRHPGSGMTRIPARWEYSLTHGAKEGFGNYINPISWAPLPKNFVSPHKLESLEVARLRREVISYLERGKYKDDLWLNALFNTFIEASNG